MYVRSSGTVPVLQEGIAYIGRISCAAREKNAKRVPSHSLEELLTHILGSTGLSGMPSGGVPAPGAKGTDAMRRKD